MRAYITGIACFAFVCSGFWVLKYRTRLYRVRTVFRVITYDKHGIDIDTDAKEREDRISQLPDDVISLIISRLHFRDAVRTSLLSRRWRHVYTFVTEVRFFWSKESDAYPRCYSYKGERHFIQLQRKFMEGVDSFLQRHSGFKIRSFELVCRFRGCFLETFIKWMNSIGTLGVEELTLGYCSTGKLLQSDPPIFSTEPSWVDLLWLQGSFFQTPNQNALKVLELDDIALTSEAVECILSNCSGLQSLKLKCCVLPSKLQIHGPDLQLKSLMIYHCLEVQEIDLYAINLITFQLWDLIMVKLSFSYVPLLQNLFIKFIAGEVPHVFGEVAKILPHLKCLIFQANANFFQGYEIARAIGNVNNLRQLDLLLEYENNLDLLALATILDVCPFLHKFHLSMMLPSTFNGRRAEKRVVRHNTQLKEVEFCGFTGTKNEHNFILYILQNALSLERLSIFLHARFYNVDLGWIQATGSNPRDDAKKYKIIRKRLQGHAISKNVKIVIA